MSVLMRDAGGSVIKCAAISSASLSGASNPSRREVPGGRRCTTVVNRSATDCDPSTYGRGQLIRARIVGAHGYDLVAAIKFAKHFDLGADDVFGFGAGAEDAEEVELLYRYVDGDTSLLRKILVDNPARLHGFEK